MRRTLIIIASVIVLLGILVLFYFIFFAKGGPGIAVGPNPFAGSGDRDPGSIVSVDTGVPVQGAGEVVAPRLLKIADGPVARGAIALYIPPVTTVSTTTASGTPETVVTTPEEVEVHYIERQSGNIYSFRIHERTSTRISNKTLPGIQEAAWLSDGSRAFVRFLEKDSGGAEHLSTYMLPSTGEGGYFLEQDLSEVRTASTSVLSLFANGNGSVASIAGPDGRGARTLFSSLLSSLHIQFAGAGYLATTKASANLDGYAFSVDNSGVFTRLLGPLRGLSALPNPSGTQLIYSYTDRNKLYMQAFDLLNRTATALPLATLAEKCAWEKGADAVYCAVPTALPPNLPDDWYQGAYTFSDRIWKIDLGTRVATLVFDPKQLADTGIDAQALTLDSASDVLIFMNKTDGSLWSYDL